MNVSKFLLLVCILIAVVSQVALYLSSKTVIEASRTILNLTHTFLVSIVLAYVFLVYVVYKVKFHDDDE